jgi:hypothetical protein
MGSHFRLPLLRWPWEAISAYVEGLTVYHADMDGGKVSGRQICADE